MMKNVPILLIVANIFVFSHKLEATIYKPYNKVCLKSSAIIVECDAFSTDNPKNQSGQLTVYGSDSLVDYKFWARRLYDKLPFCNEVAQTIRALISKRKIVCISGDLSRNELSHQSKDKFSFSAAIDTVENEAGCWSYFEGDCARPRAK